MTLASFVTEYTSIRISVGRFHVRVSSPLPSFWDTFQHFYSRYPVLPDTEFCDFSIRIARPGTIRKIFRQQAIFELDGRAPFLPLPVEQAFPFFEWGLNWCMSEHMHRYLLIHAAVVEKQGRAVVLPAPPGSGKSTLCAALVSRGWRLLSDELAIIEPEQGMLVPFPRPISLKNNSIELMKNYAPDHLFGPVFRDTKKGDVGHMGAPPNSVARALEIATPSLIIFPRFKAGAELTLESLTRARALLSLSENSFNSDRLGEDAFRTLTRFVAKCDPYRFEYSRLDEAVSVFDKLVSDTNKHSH